jgi:hypothetical protein
MKQEQIRSEIEYFNNKLLSIIKSFNPNYPLGDGLKAQIIHYRKQIEELDSMLK